MREFPFLILSTYFIGILHSYTTPTPPSPDYTKLCQRSRFCCTITRIRRDNIRPGRLRTVPKVHNSRVRLVVV
ncbi:hypothetical protein F5B17DRAFT_408157 [Nemania serpens]|nr:hypothetical protein F5B17DRAFT_408157 [Nemania serpens]